MANSRVSRGRKTQELAAEFLGMIFPRARSNPASLAGKDILETPGFAFEVKARHGFNPTAALKQAKTNAAPHEYPVVIMRPDGYGPEKIGQWVVCMDFDQFRILIADMGPGDAL